ncbi:hypothetical protein SJI19_24415 [Acerihabitans sp. TG2]|uniref:hypothetical protein n=1 Tax=Acerihabitans sp. TG2 TaxID=3096008 RepID=UPI002B22B27B|nr:hypothetical protein [Acerihabitans sp. TG2]MEA9393622.1 hypothetical protein [Acerihabitans sp. TG2]
MLLYSTYHKVTALFSVFLLAGCSALLPLDYRNYEGKDAATVVVKNPKGFVGTFYLSIYEKKGACFNRAERYELDSNFFPSEGRVLTGKVQPGRLMAFQQLNATGPWGDGTQKYNKAGYVESRWASFIPQPGKRYFLDSHYGVREIPADYAVTVYTEPAKLFSEFKTPVEPNWDATNRCHHLIGGS